MILIADSGSTKTEWILCGGDAPTESVFTKGFNPYYQDIEELVSIVNKELSKIDDENVSAIYYYGSGCSTDIKRYAIRDILRLRFTKSTTIEVEHDLLAAARALCGKNAGIACILGTGMNSCKYDGENITENLNSLGFMFADEGSGSHLGKSLLAAYFKDKLPKHIADKFSYKYDISLEEMLSNVYNKSGVGKYLASFSPFILENINEIEVKAIAMRCFEEFFEENIMRYSNYKEMPCNFVGSISFYYKDIISEVAAKYGITLGRILQTPSEGLKEYHTS